ncbi:GTP-binding protein [Ammoniphilus sp. CFH 90114]|nr:GTP-binding protein [Ammoniphilus sp. CFH 90114]
MVLLIACSEPVSTSPSLDTTPKDLETQEKEEASNKQAVEVEKPVTEVAEVAPEGEEEEQAVSHPPFEYPDAIRGIYVTGHSAGGQKFPDLLKLVETTDLNAMVIDIKDDHGWITYKMEGDMEPFSKPFMKDPKALVQTLSDHKIYPIARIVVFKDSVLAGQKPELSFKNGGQVWKNRRGEAFVNPFLTEVWQHNVEIAKEAAKLGFQEIQFDYVRFPEGFENRDKTLTYGMGNYTKDQLEPRLVAVWEKKKIEWETEHQEAWAEQREAQPPSETLAGDAKPAPIAIQESAPPKPEYDAVAARVTAVTDFVEYAKKELEPYNVKVSVDIFGYTATLSEAPGIGQNFTAISNHVDVISSMIYPSHWGPGYFNIPKPDTDPHRLVQEYAKMENQKLAQMENPPLSRPWIQDFTAPWLGKGNYIPYGKREVELQIKALNEAGIKEFLLWNAGNNYTPNVDYTPLN